MKGNESSLEAEVKGSSEQANAQSLSQAPSTLNGKNEASIRKSHFQRCRTWLGTNWSGIVASCALLVSVLALNASIESGAATRLHNRLSVRPYIGLTYMATDGGAGWVLASNGAGPAIVNAFEVTVDGKSVQTWDAVLEVLGIILQTKRQFSIPIPGTYLQPGTRSNLLWVAPTDRAALMKNFGRVHLKLAYCSLYDECWEVVSPSTNQLEPISVPKRKSILGFGTSQGWQDRLSQPQ